MLGRDSCSWVSQQGSLSQVSLHFGQAVHDDICELLIFLVAVLEHL